MTTFMVIAVAIFAVLLIAGIWWLDKKTKQFWVLQISTLAAHPCPRCGKPFGEKVALAARENFLEELREKRKDFSQRIHSRAWKVKCRKCSHTSEFHFDRLELAAGEE